MDQGAHPKSIARIDHSMGSSKSKSEVSLGSIWIGAYSSTDGLAIGMDWLIKG
ncbi:hypothetical protein Pla52o_45620 [Novipirellula galeiformis]|uniref:Uncharacterized protein n=2 Tax=Novipirellula galeiformis TaxID=2528004 RepID=A0A5C6C7R0_9BACT|nr:hypothetical protein Pla52o_45620 [Novipirellula galeiformis]